MSWNEFEISKQDLIAGMDLGFKDSTVHGYWDPKKDAFIIQPTVIQPGVVVEEQPVRIITTNGTGQSQVWQQEMMGRFPPMPAEPPTESFESWRSRRRAMEQLFPELSQDELDEMYSKARGNRERDRSSRRPRPDLLDRTTRDIMREFYERMERNEQAAPVKTSPKPKAKRSEEPTDGEHLKPRRVVEV